jgi:hypothetical protein
MMVASIESYSIMLEKHEVIFRLKINNIKVVLQERIINHIMMSLVPYDKLKVGPTKNNTQEGIRQMLESFF